MKPRTHIKKMSASRAVEMRQYPKVKRVFLKEHNICIRCVDYVPLRDRTVHHYFGRVQELLCYVPGFRMACLRCHDWIEHHRNESVTLGFRAPDNLFNRPSLVIDKRNPVVHTA